LAEFLEEAFAVGDFPIGLVAGVGGFAAKGGGAGGGSGNAEREEE